MTAYYTQRPRSLCARASVWRLLTSGHRGSAFDTAFNEAHILAMSRAISITEQHKQIHGPLFLGMDTHALSESAFASAPSKCW